jgi:hypothetical protein
MASKSRDKPTSSHSVSATDDFCTFQRLQPQFKLIKTPLVNSGRTQGSSSEFSYTEKVTGVILLGWETFYRYTSGRWLWDEDEQLSRRYVKFNVTELDRIAAQSTGSASCVEATKLPEGSSAPDHGRRKGSYRKDPKSQCRTPSFCHS